MNAIAAAYPAIAQVVDLTETYDTPATIEGRHFYALKISDNVEREEDETAMMVVSNHHAREIVTPVIALDAMDESGKIYLSMRNAFSVPQLSGANEDVFIFNPVQLGRITSGTYNASLLFDDSSYGLTANDISALDIKITP